LIIGRQSAFGARHREQASIGAAINLHRALVPSTYDSTRPLECLLKRHFERASAGRHVFQPQSEQARECHVLK